MKPKHNIKKAVLCASITAIIGSGSTSANVLEEVVITAQKREQNLQDVGISVTAMSGDQMSALGLDNTQEITQQVPGLQIQTFTPGLLVFNLRGISQNNFLDNMEAPVAAYFDDVYVGSMNAIGGQIFDMKRTEVLRGPQGTLFGRNATGGLVHFITNKANDDVLNGYVRAEVAEFNSQNLEGAVGGALSDSVRYRVAGRWEQSDGYFEPGPNTAEGIALSDEFFTGFFGFPYETPEGGDGSDANGADAYAIRGNLQIDASDNTTIDLTASYSEVDDAPYGQYVSYLVGLDENGLGLGVDADNPLTGDPLKHSGDDFSFAGSDTGTDRELTSLTAHITSELSNGMEFTSITNWLDMDKSHRENVGGAAYEFFFVTEADYEQWSQEFRLSGEGDRFRWQVGAYYLNMELDSLSSTGGPLLLTLPGGRTDNFTEMESTNWSVFGQLEYDINESFTIIAGYRWSQDDKDIKFQSIATTGNLDPFDFSLIPDGTVLFDLEAASVGEFSSLPEIDYGDYAARLQLNWLASDDALVFLSYNRGIKGGNWSTGSGVAVDDIKHDEETLHAYELGVKTTFLDGLARLNATAFYYDYEDYQAFSLIGFVPQINNTDATNQGGEIELTLLPNEHWDIMLGLSFLDSEIDSAPTPFGVVENAELPQAPGYSFNYLARYNWDAMGGNVAVQVDGVYNDDQFIESHNAESSLQEAYGVVNASIAYTSGDESWNVRGWVKNLNDEDYAIYSLDIVGVIIRQYGPPRAYGLTASFNF